MKRPARASALPLLAAALLVTAACTSSEPPAAQTAAEPAAAVPAATAVPTSGDPAVAPAAERPKYYRPVKGTASIEVIQGTSRRVPPDMVTLVRIKNTSPGRIDLLQIDEYWYDKDVQHVSGSSEKWRKPFNPGDIIEITMKSPIKPNLYRSMLMFSHANGKIEVKTVDKFEEDDDAK